MQPKRSPLLLATAALGVLAIGGLAVSFLMPHGGPSNSASNGAAVAAQPTPTPVPSMRWIAATDIPPRTRITPAMLAKAPVTGKDATAPGGISDLKDVEGELTNEPIPRGHLVSLTSFTSGLKRVLPANIEVPSGFRAVAIFVDPVSTAASLVDVGDYVDVIAVHKLSIDKDKNQIVVGALQFSAGRLIGSDLRVLAVEKSLGAPAVAPTPSATVPGAPADPNAPAPTPTPPPPPAAATAAPTKIRVLLAAPVEVATRLVAAGDSGTLHITIRNPMDGDQTASPEAHEYPSRIIMGAATNDKGTGKPSSASGADKPARSGRRIREPLMPDAGMGSFPTASAPPQPPVTIPAPPLPAPAGPPTKDITVIRGTEKTRVIVPQR